MDRDEGGLESALEELASSTSKLTGISCSFVTSGLVPALNSAPAIHLFRIAQEAVSNALKHGQGKSVVIALDTGEGICSLRVSDDGIGFQPSSGEGTGLAGINDRLAVFGGDAQVTSEPGKGTVVGGRIPLSAAVPA